MNSAQTSQLSETKLQRYLGLADSVCSFVNGLIADGSKILEFEPQGLTLRERVLIGLAIKAYNSFECLLRDARALRSEAFHHLKILAETHVYFQWVGTKIDDTRAKLLLAEVCRCKLGVYDANPFFDPDNRMRDNLKRTLQAFVQGLQDEWSGFKNSTLKELAEDTNADMVGWYNRVYKIACEPAQISDLSEYVPSPRGPINQNPPAQNSGFRAHIALDFALQIICDLLKNISNMYELDLTKAIAELKPSFTQPALYR